MKPIDLLVNKVIWTIAECHDNTDPQTGLWAHLRRDPEAFQQAVKRVLVAYFDQEPTCTACKNPLKASDVPVRLLTSDYTCARFCSTMCLHVFMGKP